MKTRLSIISIFVLTCFTAPAAPPTQADIDRATARLAEQKAKIQKEHEAMTTKVQENFTKQFKNLEDTFKRQGNLEMLLALREATETMARTGQTPPLADSVDSMIKRAFKKWESTVKNVDRTRNQKLVALYKAYAAHMDTTKKRLTMADSLDLALTADAHRKSALEEIEKLTAPAKPGPTAVAISTPDPKPNATRKVSGRMLADLKAMIWNRDQGRWELKPLEQLKQTWHGSDLTVSMPPNSPYKYAKVVLPVPVASGNTVVFEIKGTRSVELVDSRHKDRAVFTSTENHEGWQTYQIHLKAEDQVAFQRNGEHAPHRFFEKDMDPNGSGRFSLTGFFPGMTFTAKQPVTIRRIEVNSPD